MAHPEVELEQLLERVDEIVDAALPRRRPSLGDISAGMVEYEDSTRKGVSGIVLQAHRPLRSHHRPRRCGGRSRSQYHPGHHRGGNGRTCRCAARSGYKGLMQAGRDERQFHPETSIRTGIQTFKKFRDKSLSPRLRALGINLKTVDRETMVRWVMVSYNAGPGTVLKAVEYARASGNVGAWMRPEHFQRALLHTGAYDITTAARSCLKGRSASGGQVADPERSPGTEAAQVQEHHAGAGPTGRVALATLCLGIQTQTPAGIRESRPELHAVLRPESSGARPGGFRLLNLCIDPTPPRWGTLQPEEHGFSRDQLPKCRKGSLTDEAAERCLGGLATTAEGARGDPSLPIRSMVPSHALTYAQAHRQRVVAELQDFVRFPSVSAQPRHAGDVKGCAAWLADHLRRIGLEHIRVIPTPRHPIVYADWVLSPGKPTVLIYGHYDVQPADPLREWRSPPFEPVVRGQSLYGRGACDDKGQMFAHVKAIEIHLRTRSLLPVNVKCLFEGEEEIGSPNLIPFLKRHRRALAADVVVMSDSPMADADRPAITYAVRGGLGLELTVRGPRRDLHSGLFGGAVRNPLQARVRDHRQPARPPRSRRDPRLLRPGAPWPPEERATMARNGPSDATVLRDAGAAQGWGEEGYTLHERTTIRPALTINGLVGGYQGPGGKAVIPAVASAKLSFRLVPDQDPGQIVALFHRHLARIAPPTGALHRPHRPRCPPGPGGPAAPGGPGRGRCLCRRLRNRTCFSPDRRHDPCGKRSSKAARCADGAHRVRATGSAHPRARRALPLTDVLQSHRDMHPLPGGSRPGGAHTPRRGGAVLTREESRMIIDCHCHAGRGDRMTAPWNTPNAPIEPYLRRARAAGIDRTVMFAPFHSDYALANAEVARIVARYPGRLIGFAFVHSRRDAGRIFDMVNRAVAGYGFRGIKVHGHDAMPTREVCETARAFNLPLLVDVIDQASVVEMLAPQYPSVNFIIAHLGSFRDDWKAQQQVVDQLVRYPNVYADTAGVRRLRLHRPGGSPRGCSQGALRLRRPLAAPRPRTAQDPTLASSAPRRGTRYGRERRAAAQQRAIES